jgi:hypothetical protein
VKETKKEYPNSIKIMLLFMVLQVIFWFGFGIAALTGLHSAFPESKLIIWAMGGLAITASIVFACSSFY